MHRPPRALRAPKKSEPEPAPRLPVGLEPVSNGEFFPLPPTPEVRRAKEIALESAAAHARSKGVSRRAFLESACGAATALLAMNQALGCSGGRYAVPPEAARDESAAGQALGGDEFIFDVETHHVEPGRDWATRNRAFDFLEESGGAGCGAASYLACYSRDHFIKHVFLDSDTDMAILSALAGTPSDNPLHIEEMAMTRETANKLGPGPRLHIHGIVMPNLGPVEARLDAMQALKETWKISAWKLYTVWGPEGAGYWLDDPKLGIPVIERARQLAVPLVAVHKGIPLPGMDRTYTRCRDVGPVARMFPDVKFLIYHSGYEHAVTEGPYDPSHEVGIDGLIRSLEKSGIGPGGNVVAELGSVWYALMKKPTEAAHALGKLLKHLGEDNVVWGTDAIWYGSPQDQIMAFRAFEIAEELREKHGYPALSRALKAKIFGLTAARIYGVDPGVAKAALRADDLSRAKMVYREDPRPSFATFGPQTRREMLDLIRDRGGLP